MTASPYPGDDASPYEMNRLADFYRDAAYRSLDSIIRGDPLTAGPARLLAIHSIELNLSAYLLLHDVPWSVIRRMGHDLVARLECAQAKGLIVRVRTAAHIRVIARDREYLVARYGPECLAAASQMNRLLATLEEVARRVSVAVAEDLPFRPFRVWKTVDRRREGDRPTS